MKKENCHRKEQYNIFFAAAGATKIKKSKDKLKQESPCHGFLLKTFYINSGFFHKSIFLGECILYKNGSYLIFPLVFSHCSKVVGQCL